MKLCNLVQLALLALPGLAIVPEGRLMNQEQEAHRQSRYSLPSLLKLDDVSELYDNWDIRGAMELEEGRLLVKDGKGSLWARQPLPNSKDEWTVEITFRNSEQIDVDDHTFYDTNGLSLWLIDGDVPDDALNFGGPRKFDGLQFLVNNLGHKGLKIFANDATKEVVNSDDKSFGGCNIDYLDSMVPFTIRVSYSAHKNWFKVQVDNNLCFSSSALSFSRISSNLLLGVSASTNPVSKEYWEVLKLDVFDKLTKDAIDDHGVADVAPVKYVTKTEIARATDRPTQQKRPSLMEKMMAHQEQMAPVQKTGENLDKFDASLSDIASKLSLLEETVNAFDLTKIIDLSVAIDGIKQIQSLQLSVLAELKTTYENFEGLLASHYREMTDSVRVLNKEIMEEIKMHRSEVHSISGKVDLLMENHKEIEGQYQARDSRSNDSELFSTIVKWVLIPLVVGIVAVIVVVYRLKKDIKHSKLL